MSHSHTHTNDPAPASHSHQHGPSDTDSEPPPHKSRTVPLRIAVVQFAPKIGDVAGNIAKARELCSKLNPRSVDLVCFPELIFTGYNFPSSASIAPHLESSRTGPTSLFCAELARRLECFVCAGYPERLDPSQHEIRKAIIDQGAESGKEVVHDLIGVNAAVVYGPKGEWVGGYRKTNLFKTDMTWAVAGKPPFLNLSLPAPLHQTTLGICMDLNPQPPADWTIIDGPYEFADHAVGTGSRVVVLLNAWLESGSDSAEGKEATKKEQEEEEEDEKDWRTLNYWAARLRPLWARPQQGVSTGDNEEEEGDVDDEGEETIVVVCNRTGEEGGLTFAGSSALFSMQRNSGRPRLLDAMGRKEEGVRTWRILI